MRRIGIFRKFLGGSVLVSILCLPAFRADAEEKQKHWAYVNPKRPEPPKVKDTAWVRNPIDDFVLARLEQEGLRPSPEAEKETLIRRLSLDLTGLPPSIEEIDSFLNDDSPDAYERVVSRLLASPHYGERWARAWLDLARYADTNGYERDRTRQMWLYRDWVIEAFNRNMPFDQFTLEQIAGDLLPNPTLQQYIATGFHRNTMINDEPGVYAEDFRVAAVVDRVNTTATVWLGTTLECAQCHDHKYDPFTQEDYYRFFAFFNNDEPDLLADALNISLLSWGPQAEFPTPQQTAQRKMWADEFWRLERTLQNQTRGLDAAQAAWEQDLGDEEETWTGLDPTTYYSVAGAELVKQNDQWISASGKNPPMDIFVVEAETVLKGITGVRLQVIPHESPPPQNPLRSPTGGLILSGFRIELSPTPQEQEATVSLLPHPSKPEEAAFSLTFADRFSDQGLAIFDQQSQYAFFVMEKPFGFKPGTKLKIMARLQSEQKLPVTGRFHLSITTAEHPGIRLMKPILSLPASARTGPEKQTLAAYFRSISPLLQPTRDRLAQVRRSLNTLEIPTTLVMKQRAEPRRTQIHLRGNFLHKGKQVWPAVPSSLHPLPRDAPLNRLGLARWLVDRNNPLVARVTVNRFWEQIFGRGIVESGEDFGTRGEPPTHPHLLDWLATEFTRTGWDPKALLGQIVTSATYRQSSRVTPDGWEQDPYNRLLARGSRFRVEAEAVRDIALTASGLLHRKIGGPSVFPPQPEGTLQNSFSFYELKARWVNDTGEDRFRRGLYTFWRRTAPYPSFLTFDAPRRNVCTVRRSRTNTPLQVLTTLNDPTFVEAAVGLARRLMNDAGPAARDRAIHGFRLCASRKPDLG